MKRESKMGKIVLSRYFSTRLIKISKDAAWLSLTQVLILVSGVIASLLFAHLVEPEVYGRYQFLLSVFGMMGFLGLSGMSTAITRGVVKKRNGAYLGAVKLLLIISPLGLGLAWILLGDQFSIWLLVSIWALFVLYHTMALTKALYHGQRKFKQKSQLDMVGTLVGFLFLSIYILFFSVQPLMLLIISIATPSIPWMSEIFTNLRSTVSANKSWWRDKDLRYGISLSMIDVFPTAAAHIDKLVVGLVLSNTDLAVYSFALAIPILMQSLIKTATLAVIPDLIETNSKQFVYKLLAMSIGITIVCVGGFWIVAEYIFKFLYPQYLVSVPYSRIAGLILLGIPGFLVMTYYQVRGERRILGVLTLISSLIMIGSIYSLTQSFGLWGAVWARVASRMAMTLLAVGYLLWQTTNNKQLK